MLQKYNGIILKAILNNLSIKNISFEYKIPSNKGVAQEFFTALLAMPFDIIPSLG